jgi:hypothetical protein
MPRQGSRWLLAVAALLGAIFGVAVTTLWQRDGTRTVRGEPNEKPGAAPVVAAGSTHEVVTLQRMQALETRLRELESRPAPDAGKPARPREQLSPEQGRALVQAEVERVRREARDPSWAPGIEKSLTTEFRELAARGHFELGPISCGTTSCIAEVTWDADASPIEFAPVILHHPFEVNCARTVVGPTPDQLVMGGKNRGQVLFECTEFRAQGMR